jgi:hypothetical protein
MVNVTKGGGRAPPTQPGLFFHPHDGMYASKQQLLFCVLCGSTLLLLNERTHINCICLITVEYSVVFAKLCLGCLQIVIAVREDTRRRATMKVAFVFGLWLIVSQRFT